jgi:hypothetical protein
MIIDKKTHFEDDNTIGYVDIIFESSSVLKTTYFPKKEKLYVHFKRGGTYSYLNVNNNLFEQFVLADSQGKFLAKEIKSKPKDFPYKKEFTLSEREINEINNLIKEHKENNG